MNDLPTTEDITTTIDENRYSRRMAGITLQGSDIDGDDLTYSVVSDASNGTTSISGETLTYTATQDWNGTETITYKANDGTGDSNTSSITITVTPVNDVPVVVTAGDDSSTDLSMSFDGSDYLSFDFDYSTYDIVSSNSEGNSPATAHGLASNSISMWVYFNDFSNATLLDKASLNNSANGVPAQFSIKVDNGNLKATSAGGWNSDIETISYATSNLSTGTWYHIAWVNEFGMDGNSQGGSGSGQQNNTSQGHRLYINGTFVGSHYNSGAQVLIDQGAKIGQDYSNGNDFNGYMDGFALFDEDITASEVSEIYNQGRNYDLRQNTGNYDSKSDLRLFFDFSTTTDSKLDDRVGNSNQDATITGATIDAGASSFTLDEDSSINIILDATDVEEDEITYAIDSSPTNGTANISGNRVTYTPDSNYFGSDSFDWTASDGNLTSTAGTVTLTITAVEDSPTTEDVSASTDEDTAVDITLDGTDPDTEDTLTYSIVATNDGSVTVSGSTATYTPDANWNGTDTFTYKLNDGDEDSNTSTVTITVAAVNDGPTSSDEGISLDEDGSVRTGFSSTDVEGDTITLYEIVSQPSNGTASIDMSNAQPGLYTPDANYYGTDSFTYRASDGTDWGNTATATVTINSVDDDPTTSDVSASTDEDTAVDITLDGTDPDTEDTLTYSIVSDVSNGTTSLSGSTVTYTPSSGFAGNDTFTYNLNDGDEDSNTSTVTITVNEENNTSLEFDGVDDRLYIDFDTSNTEDSSVLDDAILGTTSLTVQAWVKPDAYENNKYILSKGTNSNWMARAFGLKGPYLDESGWNNKWLFEMNWGNGEKYLPSTSDATLGEWHHLVATYDGSTMKLYVNGTLENSLSISGTVANSDVEEKAFWLGGQAGGDYHWDGTLDEVAIWGSVLTATEIQTLYNNGDGIDARGTQPANMELYFNFEDNNAEDKADDGGSPTAGTNDGSLLQFPPSFSTDTPND